MIRHTTTDQETRNMTTTIETPNEFIAHVWDAASGRVTKTKPYKTEDGALAFAEKTAADAGVKEVTITIPGATKRYRAVADKKGVVQVKTSYSRKPAERPTPKATRARKAPVETGPALLRGEPGLVKTWAKALAYTDGALAAGYDARVQVLGEPKGLDLGSTDETAKFDASYLRFLRGDQKWVPTSAAQFGLDADQRKARRAAVRLAVAKAAKVEVVETANGPVPA